MVLNNNKLIPNDLRSPSCSFRTNLCSFRTNLVSFRTFRRPLFPKPVYQLGLFCRFLQQDGSSNSNGQSFSGKCCTNRKVYIHFEYVQCFSKLGLNLHQTRSLLNTSMCYEDILLGLNEWQCIEHQILLLYHTVSITC